MKIHVKIFTAMFAAALALGLLSCSRDNDEPEDLIVGRWEVQYTSRTSHEDQTTEQSCLGEEEEWLFCFKHDRTGYISHTYVAEMNDYEDFTYSISGSTLTITMPEYPCGKGSGEGTYTETFNIDKLDNQEAVLRMLHESPDSDYRIHMKRIGN